MARRLISYVISALHPSRPLNWYGSPALRTPPCHSASQCPDPCRAGGFGQTSAPAFGATSAPAFGATSAPAFGFGAASSTPAFGASAPAFGAASSASLFGAASTPAFGAAGGTSLFGATQQVRSEAWAGGQCLRLFGTLVLKHPKNGMPRAKYRFSMSPPAGAAEAGDWVWVWRSQHARLWRRVHPGIWGIQHEPVWCIKRAG